MVGRWRWRGGSLWLLTGATAAAAQTTGTPSSLAPPPLQFVNSLGLYGSAGNRGAGLAIEGEYRFVPGSRRFDFGVRAGIASDSTSSSGLKLIGVDARYSFFHETPELPVDAALTAGIGARFGGNTDLKLVPVGVTLGRHLTPPSGGVLVTTYMHPKMVFVTGDKNDRFVFNISVGFNLLFARGVELRFGGTVGEFGGVGLGLRLFRPQAPEAPEVSGGGAP